MCFTSNSFGELLNKACTVIWFECFRNTKNFNARIKGTVLGTKIEDYQSMRIPSLSSEDCEDKFGF